MKILQDYTEAHGNTHWVILNDGYPHFMGIVKSKPFETLGEQILSIIRKFYNNDDLTWNRIYHHSGKVFYVHINDDEADFTFVCEVVAADDREPPLNGASQRQLISDTHPTTKIKN